MIFNPCDAFKTAEDEEKLAAIKQKMDDVFDSMKKSPAELTDTEKDNLIQRLENYIEERGAIERTIERRYIDTFNGKSVDDVLDEMQRICDMLTRQDYDEHMEEMTRALRINPLEADNSRPHPFILFSYALLRVQLNTLAVIYNLTESPAEVNEIIRETATRLRIEFGGEFPEVCFQVAEKNKQQEQPATRITRPKFYAMPISKPVYKYLTIQDMLTTIEPNGQLTFIQDEYPVEVGTKKRQVTDLVSISYNGDLDGKAAKITGFDQSVYNGISSYVNAGIFDFSIEDLIKTITQRNKITSNQVERYMNSLHKFRGTSIRLDISEELKAGLITDEEGNRIVNGILDDSLLSFKALPYVTDKGKTKTLIHLLDVPSLYYYSNLKGHIISFPVEYLELSGKATDDAIPIRDYLLREINQIKKKYRDNTIINYNSILMHIGKTEISRTEKARITTTVVDILEGLRKKNFISGYKVKAGAHNVTSGFEIIP